MDSFVQSEFLGHSEGETANTSPAFYSGTTNDEFLNDFSPPSNPFLAFDLTTIDREGEESVTRNFLEMIPADHYFDLALHCECLPTETSIPTGELLIKKATKQLSSYLRTKPSDMQAYIQQIIGLFQLDEEVFLTAVVILYRYVQSARAFLKIKQDSEMYYLILLSVIISCKALFDIPLDSGVIARYFNCDPSNVFNNEVQIMKSLHWSVFFDREDLVDSGDAIPISENDDQTSLCSNDQTLQNPLPLSTIMPIESFMGLTYSKRRSEWNLPQLSTQNRASKNSFQTCTADNLDTKITTLCQDENLEGSDCEGTTVSETNSPGIPSENLGIALNDILDTEENGGDEVDQSPITEDVPIAEYNAVQQTLNEVSTKSSFSKFFLTSFGKLTITSIFVVLTVTLVLLMAFFAPSISVSTSRTIPCVPNPDPPQFGPPNFQTEEQLALLNPDPGDPVRGEAEKKEKQFNRETSDESTSEDITTTVTVTSLISSVTITTSAKSSSLLIQTVCPFLLPTVSAVSFSPSVFIFSSSLPSPSLVPFGSLVFGLSV